MLCSIPQFNAHRREYRVGKWAAWLHKCAWSVFAVSVGYDSRERKDKCQKGDILRGNIFKRHTRSSIDTCHRSRTSPCGSHTYLCLITLIIVSWGPWRFTATTAKPLSMWLRSPYQVSQDRKKTYMLSWRKKKCLPFWQQVEVGKFTVNAVFFSLSRNVLWRSGITGTDSSLRGWKHGLEWYGRSGRGLQAISPALINHSLHLSLFLSEWLSATSVMKKIRAELSLSTDVQVELHSGQMF